MLCLFVPLHSIELSHLHVKILGRCVCVCVCTICPSLRLLVLGTLININVHKLDSVSLSTHSSPKWGILMLGGR
jgi:hypothetical protein